MKTKIKKLKKIDDFGGSRNAVQSLFPMRLKQIGQLKGERLLPVSRRAFTVSNTMLEMSV